jgi:hypothetical protein
MKLNSLKIKLLIHEFAKFLIGHIHDILVTILYAIILVREKCIRPVRFDHISLSNRSHHENKVVSVVVDKFNKLLPHSRKKPFYLIYGSTKRRLSLHHLARGAVMRTRRVVVLEQPPIDRGEVSTEFTSRSFRVGLNGFLRTNCFEILNAELTDFAAANQTQFLNLPNVETDNFELALICGQLPGDASLRDQDIFNWIGDVVETIRKRYSNIVIRTPQIGHEAYWRRLKYLLNGTSVRLEIGTHANKMQSITSASCVFSYSSTFSVDVLKVGKMQCIDSPDSFLFDIFPTTIAYSMSDYSQNWIPARDEIEERANCITAIEYSIDEFEKESKRIEILVRSLASKC